MAEETPDNLSGFGGHVAGRAADDNRGIDRATDRLESEINKFSEALERLTSSIGQVKSSGGGGQQTAHGNGGQVTFGGGAHRLGGEPGPGMMASAGAAVSSVFSSGGGSHATTSHRESQAGRYGSMAGKAVVGAATASTLFAANHYSSQSSGQTLAAMYGGEDWNRAYQASFRGNFTAHGDKDHWATISAMGARSGFRAEDPRFKQAMTQTMSYSAVNPTITNQAAITAQQSVATTTSFNRLARMGINPLGSNGQGDPRSIARQLLSKMGSQKVKTKEQAQAAFGSAGSATVTLDSYVNAGYIPPESRNVIESEMRNILLAQVKGTNFEGYAKLASKVNTSEAARDKLESMDITTDSMVQQENRKGGRKRDIEGETIVGFAKGVRIATDTLDLFNKRLEQFLSIPGVGEASGLLGGLGVSVPGVGGFISKVGGIIPGMPGGDGPSSMAGSQRSYSVASGAGAAKAGFGMGGMAMRGSMSTPASGSSQPTASKYSLGGVKPWVAKAASILGPMFGISSIGGVAPRSTPSDHPTGHALDFMCGKSAGDRLAAYACANAKQLNITYVIWQQRIWSVGQPGWRKMEDRGSPTDNHMDHVHVSFLHSPTNGDYSNLPSGGGLGKGQGATLGAGASSPDNGSVGGAIGTGFSAAGGYSEVGALGLGGGGGMAGGGAGGSGGSLRGSAGGGGGGGTGGSMSSPGGFSGSGAAGTIRTGTVNVGSLKGGTNPTSDVERMINGADVLSLTETNPARIAALRKGLADNNWGVFAGDGSATGRYAQDASIVYDKSKYTLSRGGTKKLGNQTGNFLGGKGARFANYALLTDKDTGMSFWQVSAHTVPMANADMKHRSMFQEQFNSLDELSQMLQKTGMPVVMAGDFNQQRNRDFWRDPAGMRSGRKNGVDHVFGSTGDTKQTSMQMVTGMSGDHTGGLLTTLAVKGAGAPAARGNGGTPAQNMALGQAMASARGWSGAQWDALNQLWQHESGWRTDADNPTSSAYGIPQALTQLHGLGAKYMKDPKTQINWGLNYIAGRYGDPSKAWDFWQKNNYYKQGNWDVKENAEAQIHMGEMILPSKIADIVRNELTAPGISNALGSSKGGSGRGVQVTFEKGSIVVALPGGDEAEARQAGKWVVDAIIEDRRLNALAEG